MSLLEQSEKECYACGQTDESLKRCSECHVAVYCSRECQTIDWKIQHKSLCKYMKNYIIAPVEGYGIGMLARRDLKLGECIIAEKPCFTLGSNYVSQAIFKDTLKKVEDNLIESLDESIKNLTDNQRKTFFSLHDKNETLTEGKTPIGIFQTNGLEVGDDPSSRAIGVFLILSRVNHSCVPNANRAWNDDLKVTTLYAARDIKKGEQIFISYIHSGSRAERQEYLEKCFNFTCKCKACSLEGEELEESDKRRKMIELADEQVIKLFKEENIELALRYILKRIDLIQLEYPDVKASPDLTKSAYDAHQAYALLNDKRKCVEFIDKAYRYSMYCRGDDSPGTRELKDNLQETLLWAPDSN